MDQVPTTPATPALELSKVVKSFGAVVALRSGTITLHEGSIHALIGENGAGKSTLVKIIAGLYRRDAGTFRLRGEEVDFHTTAQSKAAGIAVIYQEPTLPRPVGHREHLHGPAADEPLRPHRPQGDAHRGRRDLRRLGVSIDPDRITEGLSIADQQIIEIAKAISLDARVLIMDEPTAALGRRGRAAVRRRAEPARRGPGADVHLAPLRRGVRCATPSRSCATAATSPPSRSPRPVSTSSCARWWAGMSRSCSKLPAEIGDDVLVVEGLTRMGVFHDISFTVRAGEIGLAGLVGAGRSEVARAIFGVDPYESGSVRLGGRPCRRAIPAWRWRAASRSCPRTAASRASCSTSPSRATSPSPSEPLAKGGLLHQPGRERRGRGVGQSPRGQDRGARRRDRHGRQPAEGRARQVARDRAEGAHRRRAHPRHRRRHQVRGAPPAVRARAAGPGDPHDLVGASRGARHGRPRASCARDGSPASSPLRSHPEP